MEAALRRREIWALALGVILVFALWLRWPLPPPDWTHFDEESLVLLPLGFWGGDLNPHFFNYPTFHFYLLSFIYLIQFLIAGTGTVEQHVALRFFVDGSDLLAVARGVSTIMSVATVAICAVVARSLYGTPGGLAAALILAVMPLSVRYAHLAGTDTPAVFWVALALAASMGVYRKGRLRDFLLAGLFVGLAGATKYPASLCAMPVAVAALLRRPSLKQPRLWLAGLVAMTVFCGTSPYVLLDSATFWADFSEMGRDHLVASRDGGSSLLYHAEYTLRYGLGLLGALAVLGALIWKPRAWRHEEIILFSAIAVFVAFIAVAESVFMRYALPLAPLFALFTARLTTVCRLPFGLAGLAVVVAEPIYASVTTKSLLAGDDTRERAVTWLERHAPGRRITHTPVGCGNIQVLTPHRVHVRQTHFRDSYSDERLARAYEWLSAHPNLPPLYLDRVLTPEGEARPRDPGGSPPGDPSPDAEIRYSHPVCPPAVDWPATTTRATYSAGDLSEAVFDAMDWYFVPIGGFGGIMVTGPEIAISTYSSLRPQPPSANRFFELLATSIRARQQMASEHWPEASKSYAALLPNLSLPEIFPPEHLYELQLNAGHALNQLSHHQEALEPLLKASIINPLKYEAYDGIALASASLGRLDEAIEAWERVVELQPHHGTAYFNLAKALYNSGRYHRAYEVALQGIELTPGHPMAASVRRFVEMNRPSGSPKSSE